MSTYVHEHFLQAELARAEAKLCETHYRLTSEDLFVNKAIAAYRRFDRAAMEVIENNAVAFLLGALSAFVWMCFAS